jgi:transcriptional regulator with XRE-family HTH domain
VTEADDGRTVLSVPVKWPHEEFTRYLLALMAEAGIGDYAELSRLSGVNQTQFSNWRKGTSRPSHDNLSKIAPHLGTKTIALWVVAGLVSEADLDLPAPLDLTVFPREFVELLELYRDERLTEDQREFVRESVAMLTSGVRGRIENVPKHRGRGRR